MMENKKNFIMAAILLITSMVILNGCAYLKARGNDALDMVDIGITVTDKAEPDFALYLDFFNITPLGYSNVDGKVFGIGNRQIGLLDYTSHHWGLLIAGEDRELSGEFNSRDPHLTRPDHRDIEELPTYNSGIYRMASKGNPPPSLQFIECQRGIHLGWIGVHMNVRPLDIVDFILGWTTLDIIGDDNIND